MNNPFFEKALPQTLKNEGVVNGKTGYVNDKNDSGGETNYGITAAVARRYGYQGKMNALPFYVAREIYYKEYWKKTKAENTYFNIAFILFDFAVNTGVKNASKKLQISINKTLKKEVLKIDGVIGQKTLTELNGLKELNKLQDLFICEILGYYASLSKFNIYGKGWINRVKNNIEFLANQDN